MLTGFLDAASNREDFSRDIEVKDDETGDLLDLTGATINVALRADEAATPILTGSTADGRVVIQSTGVFTVAFSRADMIALRAGSYEFGVTLTATDGSTSQLIAATLPVVDGIVAA